MFWQGRRESDNVDDERGITGGHVAVGGGIIGVIALLINFLMGGNANNAPVLLPNQKQPLSTDQQASQDTEARFVRVVLADTEDVWTKLMDKAGKAYPKPRLVLFSNAIQSGCGNASSSSGPFYCPGDQKVYIDLSFYDELRNRFGVQGDFAMAYVIAHEVGHHIQKLLGISDKMDQLRQQMSEQDFNKYSVRLELQADYFAGVWAHYEEGNHLLEKGDIDQALNAANAIGDDRLQKQTQGYVVPESFTHGTSAERVYWLKKGYETGDISQGDTFNTPNLH